MSYVHGTYGGYTNHRCRCSECTEANRNYMRAWTARAAARVPRVHGSASTYTNYRCRCDECRAAWAAAQRARYHQRKAERSA